MLTNCCRWALIGTHTITQSFLRGAFHDPRFVLTAIYSRTPERAAEFAAYVAREHPQNAERLQVLGRKEPRLFTDLSTLAAAPEVDAVYIASPNSCHASQSMALLHAGKHVLCEKPLASHSGEVRAMFEAARCARTPQGRSPLLMEAMKTTLLPNWDGVLEALPRIGRPRRYFAQFCQYSSRYDAFKAGKVANTFLPQFSNGSLMDIGVYGLAPLVHLWGRPDEVVARGTFLPTGVDSQGSLICSYKAREIEAVIVHSKVADSHLPTEIQGEDGRIVIQKLSTMVSPAFVPRTADRSIAPGESLCRPTYTYDMYHELSHFIDLVEAGAPESPRNSAERSLAVMEILDEARRQIGLRFPADDTL